MFKNKFANLILGMVPQKYYSRKDKLMKKMTEKMAEKGPSNPMIYPYTFSAKIAQFPIKFYLQNQWVWRYYFIALLVSLPVFYKIHRMANSPENVAKWNEKKTHDEEEAHE